MKRLLVRTDDFQSEAVQACVQLSHELLVQISRYASHVRSIAAEEDTFESLRASSEGSVLWLPREVDLQRDKNRDHWQEYEDNHCVVCPSDLVFWPLIAIKTKFDSMVITESSVYWTAFTSDDYEKVHTVQVSLDWLLEIR